MKNDRYEEGRLSHDGHGLGTVTEEMILARARELAEINGRSRDQVLDTDLEEARRELTHSGDPTPRSERIPEEERWDPVPGSEPKQAKSLPPMNKPLRRTLCKKVWMTRSMNV